MEKRDEIELGIFFGLRFVFSPLLTKIRDTTLPDMERNIRENFNHEIEFNPPEKGSYVPYLNEFVLNKLGLNSKFETAYKIMQTGGIVSRTFHFIQKDFSTYLIIDYENLKESIEWRIEGEEGKTDSDNKEHILVLPHVRITAKSEVTTKDDGFVFNLTNGQPQVLLHIETFPMYKEFEQNVIIADSSQVDEVAAVLGFFPDHKYVPVIFFENKDNHILRMNINSKEFKDQKERIIKQRNQMQEQIFELRPKNIIILNSPPEIGIIKQISSSINAKVHHLTDPVSGNCLSLEEVAETVSQILYMDYNIMSVENHSYLAAACVLARIKGTPGKALIPIVQSNAEHEFRIGSAGYGSGEYCGGLTDVTHNILQMESYVSDEGVLIEYDGTGQSIMRSILASNYAYMNNTVPVIAEKISVVNEVEDINRDLKYVADYYKFIEYLKFYKTEILNEEDLKYSNEPRDIQTLNFLKSIDENNELSLKEIERSENLFCWQEIPGNDSERLKDFLTEKYSVHWVKTAKIDKINDFKTISLTAGKRFISLTLNNENTVVNLKIDDDRSYEFIVKTMNGNMNIYNYDIEKIIDWIDKHGAFLPDGPIEISNQIKSKLLKVSDKITKSLGGSIQLVHDFKYLTAFTDGTPYNLAKCGDEFWATRFALGHFVEDESHKVAAVLLNLLMYSKGREYPIKRILQVAPYASEHSMFKFTRQDDAYATTKLDTGEVTRKWAMTFELINDKSDKDAVIEFGKYISWFNMHFGTHGSGSSISLGKNAELRLDEIMGFNLSHTLIDLNACQTYPFAGKEILSSGASGGYATLFIVMDKTADEIGKGVFNGTLNNKEPSESLRENIEKVVKAGSDGISEFAYVHIGLPKLRPFIRDVLDSEEKEIQRMKYQDMYRIVRDWIKNKRKGQDACFHNYTRQKEEYLAKIDKDDYIQRYNIFLDEGVLEYEQEKFQNSLIKFNDAYYEVNNLVDEKDVISSIKVNILKSKILVNIINTLGKIDDIDEAINRFTELRDLEKQYPDSMEINLKYTEGLVNLIFFLGKKEMFEQAGQYITKLAMKAKQYPNSVEFNLNYAKGLNNLIGDLSNKENGGEADRYISKLAFLADRYPDSVEINLKYTEGLVNFSLFLGKKEMFEQAEQYISRLARKTEQYTESLDINLRYAYGLNNLISFLAEKEKFEEADRYISIFALHAKQFYDSLDINLRYTYGLKNLITSLCKKRKFLEAKRYISSLATEAEQYPDSAEINLNYAAGLVNLMYSLDNIKNITEAELYISALGRQADRYPESIEINLIYATGLFNLINYLGGINSLEQIERYISELAEQTELYPDSEEINLYYAKGLFNLITFLCKKEEFEHADRYILKLANHAERYPGSEDIILRYAGGLNNMIKHLGEIDRVEEAERYLPALSKLVEGYPYSVEINLNYARALYNLITFSGKKERFKQAEKYVSALSRVATMYQDSEKINLEYTEGLVNLIIELNKEKNTEEIEKYLSVLAKRAEKYPDSVEISFNYARGLAIIILSSFKTKDYRTTQKYLNILDRLTGRFVYIQQIQELYDQILEVLNKE